MIEKFHIYDSAYEKCASVLCDTPGYARGKLYLRDSLNKQGLKMKQIYDRISILSEELLKALSIK